MRSRNRPEERTKLAAIPAHSRTGAACVLGRESLVMASPDRSGGQSVGGTWQEAAALGARLRWQHSCSLNIRSRND
jgi:hypothetical protein